MSLKDKINVRRDTTANFTSANPVLSLGEISFDTTTKQFKVGDGASTWNSLPYADAAATASSISTALASYTPTSSLSAIATSGSASDLTGTLAKSQQHAQTVYKDEANTFSQAQTVPGGLVFGQNSNSGSVSIDPSYGFVIRGKAASASDFAIQQGDGTLIASNIVGTRTVLFPGTIGVKTSSTQRSLTIGGTADAYMNFNPSSGRQFTIGSESNGFVVFDDTAGAYRFVIAPSGTATFSGELVANAGITANNPGQNSASIRSIKALADNTGHIYFERTGVQGWHLNQANAGLEFQEGGVSGAGLALISGGGLSTNGSIKLGIKTIATLPSAASSSGERYQVSDSATIANRIAFSNGSAWYYEGTAVAV